MLQATSEIDITNLSNLGIDEFTIARILNHSRQSLHMKAICNRWEKFPEMKRGLEHRGAKLK